MLKKHSGFTLIEIMIVISIIAILSAVALPKYKTYANRTKFVEVTAAVGVVKSSIDVCFQTRGYYSLQNCNDFEKIGLTKNQLILATYISDINILIDGTIIANAISGDGFNSESFVLTPTPSSSSLIWEVSNTSTCINAGFC
ncbi:MULTISPECIES: pilin [Shewanella]|uniref:pilin n=1 Tax=Shewanella TaxID=22 RepID=UPI0024B178B9|nr:prepilin-type N-terminal cleavage/methylation domain-containing protein [Shewanella basaltis]